MSGKRNRVRALKRRRRRKRELEAEAFRLLLPWFASSLRRCLVNSYMESDPCVWCGRYPSSWNRSIEHVQPKSKGGDGSWENKALACRYCNSLRSSKGMLFFMLERRLLRTAR